MPKRILLVPANENKVLCNKCGGLCCDNVPGIFHPLDLAPDGDSYKLHHRVKKLLNTGQYTITQRSFIVTYDGAMPKYIEVWALAPRGAFNKSFMGTDNIGQCALKTPVGCSLKVNERPTECLSLMPLADYKCKAHPEWRDHQLEKAWVPYQKIMKDLMEVFHEKEAIKL